MKDLGTACPSLLAASAFAGCLALLSGCGGSGSASVIGQRISPSPPPTLRMLVEYPIPTHSSVPQAITTGPDGNMWFIEFFSQRVGRVNSDGTITEFALPVEKYGPAGITLGPDASLWVNAYSAVDKLTTAGMITTFSVPPTSPNAVFTTPSDITAGPDGNVWFAAKQCVPNRPWGYIQCGPGPIVRMAPSGAFTEFSTPNDGVGSGLTVGADHNLWFADGTMIGKITTDGVISEYGPVKRGSAGSMIQGPDGNLWFTDGNDTIGKVTIGGTITEYGPLPGSGAGGGLVVGADGNIWFANGADVEKITPSGTVTDYGQVTGGSTYGVTPGPDGNLWFIASTSTTIGRITTGGNVVIFSPFSTNASIQTLVAGPRGTMWFSDAGSNKIGKFTP